jgi:hypothetical protein
MRFPYQHHFRHHRHHRHHDAAPLVVLLFAALLTLGAVTPAWAAPGQPVQASDAAARRLPAATVNNKVTLPETSVDGPALDSQGN